MSRKTYWRGLAGIVAVLIVAAPGGLELRHRATFGHWFGYGWHVDVLSDTIDEPAWTGISRVQYVAVTNFTLSSAMIEGCVPNDPHSNRIPVSPSRIQTQERSGWKTDHLEWPLRCIEGQIHRRRIWPLGSFYTQPSFVAYAGNKGDWVRIQAYSAFDESPGTRREFVSEPFRISEEALPPCPNGCVSIPSVSFCETDAESRPCRKLMQWRDRPGAPHPGKIDLVCEIQNDGHDAMDLVLLTSMDTLIAPTSQFGLADMDKMRNTVSWGRVFRVDDIKLGVAHWVRKGERRSVRISGFDLGSLVADVEIGDYALWPWWLRVNIRVENVAGDRLATSMALLPIIPPDKYLAGKKQEPVDDRDHPARITVIAPKPRQLW